MSSWVSGVASTRVDLAQQIVDVALGGGGVGEVEIPAGVGGADDPVPAPGDDEQHAGRCTQDHAGVGVDAILGDDQVNALGRPHPDLAAAGHALDLIGPGSGRVDHLAGSDRHLVTGLRAAGPDSHHPVTAAQQVDHLQAGHHHRAVARCGASDGKRVAGIVELGVPIAHCADQGVLAQSGSQRSAARRDRCWWRGRGVVAAAGEQVVETDHLRRRRPVPRGGASAGRGS